jgi:RNase P subunit RPR2
MVSYYKPLTCPCCRSAINTGEKPLIHSDDDDRNELMSLLAVLDIDMELDEFLGPPIAPTGQGQERVRCIGCRNYFAPGQMARRRVRNTDGSLRPNRVLRCNGCGED